MNFPTTRGPRNPEEMSHMMSEFHRQSLIQQPPTDQNAQPSAGYGLFSMQTSVQTPSELEPSQRLWPQSDFVSSVIEGPIEHSNPGWRDRDPISASSLRQRAEAGMQNIAETAPARSLFQKSRASQPGLLVSNSALNSSTSIARDNRKTIPSHLTHMKYKGYDPSDIDGNGAETLAQRGDSALKGTASFGSKARRRTDTVSLVEEEQKKKDLEHQLANFPPILPASLWNSLSEEEAESRRVAVEDDMRLKWNIPNRSTSPTLTRRSTYHKHGSLNRRTSVSAPQEDSRGVSSSVHVGSGPVSKSESEGQSVAAVPSVPNDISTYSSIKVAHPLLNSNNNTWNRILDHMRNHGTIVNPFNQQAKFRLRACFPPGTPIDILASGDTRQSEYPVNQEMLKKANEVVMGPDWIKMTYETKAQAAGSLSSNGVHFDGFPLEISLWDEVSELVHKNGAIAEKPRWMSLSSESQNSLPLRSTGGGESAKTAIATRDRQLVVITSDAIFVKQPGLLDRLKDFVFGYLFQNTARYDEEGNYVRGSGGIFLDLWHVLVG